MKKALIIFVLLIAFKTFGQVAPENCLNDSFAPIPGEKYVLCAWVKDDNPNQVTSFTGSIQLLNSWNDGSNAGVNTLNFMPSGVIIDGWQRISSEFTLDANTTLLELKLISMSGGTSFFDDIRIFPFNGNMKSFVYDPVTQRLMAELDENNYATFYEYDKEGGLVRVKKETERGIYTIQETRSGNSKINETP